jgi:hypothetical protein
MGGVGPIAEAPQTSQSMSAVNGGAEEKVGGGGAGEVAIAVEDARALVSHAAKARPALSRGNRRGCHSGTRRSFAPGDFSLGGADNARLASLHLRVSERRGRVVTNQVSRRLVEMKHELARPWRADDRGAAPVGPASTCGAPRRPTKDVRFSGPAINRRRRDLALRSRAGWRIEPQT